MVRNPHYRRNAGPHRLPSKIRPQNLVAPGAQPARFRRLRLVIVGAGDVGARLVALLTSRYGRHLGILATTRRPEQAQQLRLLGARVLPVDLDNGAYLKRLRPFAARLIQLAPPPASGRDDPRSRRLLAALSQPVRRRSPALRRSRPHAAPAWVYASTTGVYGDAGGAQVDETWPVSPSSERAHRRVAAERRWREAGRRALARTPIIRVPGIYAQDRLPIERLKKGLPALHQNEDVYTNHINAQDLANILWTALFRGRSNRVYHAVDRSEMQMGDYFDAVADALGLPRPPRRTRAEVAREVSPAMLSFMQESRRLTSQRLARELRVQLRFPTVAHTLASLPR